MTNLRLSYRGERPKDGSWSTEHCHHTRESLKCRNERGTSQHNCYTTCSEISTRKKELNSSRSRRWIRLSSWIKRPFLQISSSSYDSCHSHVLIICSGKYFLNSRTIWSFYSNSRKVMPRVCCWNLSGLFRTKSTLMRWTFMSLKTRNFDLKFD